MKLTKLICFSWIFLLLLINGSSRSGLNAVRADSFSHFDGRDDNNQQDGDGGGHRNDEEIECKAWLVQSIPTDMPQLHLVPGVLSTGTCPFFFVYVMGFLMIDQLFANLIIGFFTN